MQPAVQQFSCLRRFSPMSILMGRVFRLCSLAAFLLALPAFQEAPAVAQEQPSLRHARMEVIYSRSLFRTVSKSDAISALRVWGETVSQLNGFAVDYDISVADNLGEIRKRLLEGPIGLVLLDPVEFFELSGSGLLEPAFTGTRGSHDESLQYLLVANEESGAVRISDLRGKPLLIQTDSRADLGRMWIEVSVHDAGLGPADHFFSSERSVFTPSEAVLPVFFGKAGAAVVDRDSFEVMKEMNPQLGSRLRILAMSYPLLNGILCLDKRTVSYRSDLIQGLENLHKTPAGRLMLMFFKSNRLKPVTPEELGRVRTLCLKYRLISKDAATAKSEEAGVARPAAIRGVRAEVKP